jgi:hypothetical protein
VVWNPPKPNSFRRQKFGGGGGGGGGQDQSHSIPDFVRGFNNKTADNLILSIHHF